MKLILFLLCAGGAICSQSKDDVLELIANAGFTGEDHHVVTEDGYILKVHRILPRGKPVQKLPVFLMHGMLMYSSAFILSAPENSLGFLLADAGYDVWMGNTRGTKFSTNHTTLSTESSEFWTFSFHEMGFYDLPAMIDFMLEKTSAKKFFYLGHSQGCSSILVLLSMRPEYNEKVAQLHLAAPGAFFTHIRQPFLQILFALAKDGIFERYRYLNLQPSFEFLQALFCSQPPGTIQFAICEAIILGAGGPNRRKIQIDRKATQTYLKYFTPKLAVMQIVHYAQIHYSQKFQRFDHRWKNFEKENFTKPVEYNLSKITAPTFLYAGNVDAVTSDQDTVTLRRLLLNVKQFQVIDDWNHFDFIFSKEVTFYKTIIKELQTSNSTKLIAT